MQFIVLIVFTNIIIVHSNRLKFNAPLPKKTAVQLNETRFQNKPYDLSPPFNLSSYRYLSNSTKHPLSSKTTPKNNTLNDHRLQKQQTNTKQQQKTQSTSSYSILKLFDGIKSWFQGEFAFMNLQPQRNKKKKNKDKDKDKDKDRDRDRDRDTTNNKKKDNQTASNNIHQQFQPINRLNITRLAKQNDTKLITHLQDKKTKKQQQINIQAFNDLQKQFNKQVDSKKNKDTKQKDQSAVNNRLKNSINKQKDAQISNQNSKHQKQNHDYKEQINQIQSDVDSYLSQVAELQNMLKQQEMRRMKKKHQEVKVNNNSKKKIKEL